ncbi:MAG: thioredoxin family protein [Pseudomonadota bacterium]
MPALESPVCDFGSPIPDFCLPDPAGALFRRDDCTGTRGLLVMFLCNHCPFVQAVLPRLVEQARALAAEGVGSVALMPNDYRAYPADAPPEMQGLSERMDFPFPYLVDEGGEVARHFGAVCTPDFFGYNAAGLLQYRGRLDDARLQPATEDTRQELLDAMRAVARTGQGPAEQFPSMGCSIKWADA